MEKNVGQIDRSLRLFAGIVIIGAGIYLKNWWGLAGLVPLFTGTMRWCPAYLPFGLSTCKREQPAG